MPFENIVGKGEIAGYQHFSFSNNVFYSTKKKIIILATLNLSSANPFSLVQSKILLFGKELHFLFQCSVTCGHGVQTRLVTCTLANPQPVEEIQCDVNMKPEVERECILDDCKPEDFDIGVIITNTVVDISHWRVGPWSPVSL